LLDFVQLLFAIYCNTTLLLDLLHPLRLPQLPKGQALNHPLEGSEGVDGFTKGRGDLGEEEGGEDDEVEQAARDRWREVATLIEDEEDGGGEALLGGHRHVQDLHRAGGRVRLP